MSDFNANKKIKFLPLPYIGMFDLDLIYQSSDVELLYQLLEKVNALIQNVNQINANVVQLVNEIINNAIQDGSIFLDTDYDEETKTLTFVFKKIESEV